MTNETNQPTRPSHIIWQVIGDKPNARWNRIGAAWPNKDGKGLKLVFDTYPVVGRTMLRENTERTEGDNGGQQ